MRKLLSYMRAAVDDYDMISEGDNIAVGVSGGKDSVAMLVALNELKKFYDKPFTIKAITLDMGISADFSPIQQLCDSMKVEYIVKPTDIGTIIFDIRKESNPCSLCARMRRGALHDAAKQSGCNKVALGHNCDDVVETFFLNLIHEGRIGCFRPLTYLDRKQLYVVRPLIYAPERYIKSFVKRYDMCIVKNPCPVDGHTAREDIKKLIAEMDIRYNGLKRRAFGAIKRSGIDGWGNCRIKDEEL